MAQPAASPTPNVLKPPLASSVPAHLPNPLFYPRKEFLRDQPRIVSSFSLLTLAGQGFVRLHSFPDSVINGLRRLFDTLSLTTGVRESTANHFFEFSLESKPWANVKSMASEKLIVAILSVIFQYGYSFLSTIEYAREHDDRIAIAFSRPSTAPVNSSIPTVPNPNASATTLPQPVPILFAISFPSTSLLRVVEPPLSLTPAILQAVRSAWPRGIAWEKKLGDSYEFKLKGYRWFQENTFSVDSLQQILSLLSVLDRQSFSLLTNLTLGSRSRTRDLWIFMGPPGETHPMDSPPASPAGSSCLELKREVTPQRNGIPLEGHNNYGRSASPYASSPLKQVTPTNSTSSNSKLKKPWPKAGLPHAFQSDSSLNDSSLNDHGRLPSEVGSVDMTGVGTAHRRPGETPTPAVSYATGPPQPGNAYQREFNPWNRGLSPPAPQTAPPQTSQFLTAPSSWGNQHSRHYSVSSAEDSVLRGAQESPYDIAARQSQSSSSNNSRMRRVSSPLSTSSMSFNPQPLQLTPTSEASPQAQPASGRHSAEGPRPTVARVGSDPPRIPTPPLLNPAAFRDSSLSSSTGWRTTDVPLNWTSKDPEPSSTDAQLSTASRLVPFGPRERRPSSGGLQPPTHPPLERRGSGGPTVPGASPEHGDDVVESGESPRASSSQNNSNSNMIPPTIAEQPSQEGDEPIERTGNVRVHSPEQHRAAGEGARKSEAAFIGNADRHGPSPAANGHGNMPSSAAKQATGNGHANGAANGTVRPQRPPHAPKVTSISEGWVLVNIDGGRKGAVSPTRSSGQGSSLAPPLKHQRSQSDSRIPAATRRSPVGVGKSSMSAAAKAIVMEDAIQQTREKQRAGGKLRRLLGRTPDKSGSAGHTPETSTASHQSVKGSRQNTPAQTAKAKK